MTKKAGQEFIEPKAPEMINNLVWLWRYRNTYSNWIIVAGAILLITAVAGGTNGIELYNYFFESDDTIEAILND